jgi:hypothetical protein
MIEDCSNCTINISDVIGTTECINCSNMTISSGCKSFVVDASKNVIVKTSISSSEVRTDLKLFTCMSQVTRRKYIYRMLKSSWS